MTNKDPLAKKSGEYQIGVKHYQIIENPYAKICEGPDYNFSFMKSNGFFQRWGKTKKHDPQFSPIGCEILDIEVSTICDGGCPWCYKGNTKNGKNMSLETFKLILDKM